MLIKLLFEPSLNATFKKLKKSELKSSGFEMESVIHKHPSVVDNRIESNLLCRSMDQRKYRSSGRCLWIYNLRISPKHQSGVFEYRNEEQQPTQPEDRLDSYSCETFVVRSWQAGTLAALETEDAKFKSCTEYRMQESRAIVSS